MKRIFFVLFGVLFSFPVMSQEVNSYRYVIVPNKFEFTKEPNMYEVNSLAEFLFHKYGFDAFLEGEEFPDEIEKDRCGVLYADVEDNSGLFITRLNVILKDCRNNKIFVSDDGVSRAKDYKLAYHEALRQAFESIGKLNYSYNPGDKVASEKKVIEDSSQVLLETKTVVVSAIPEIPEDENSSVEETLEPISNPKEMEYVKAEIEYFLKKSDTGFDFYQKGMAEPFASLIPSQTNDSFIYSSVRDQGIASFKENGDLVIEIFKRETNSTETRIFNRRN